MEETKALFAAANKAAEKTEAKPTALSAVEPIAETITIDDFAKLDMRVAKVLKCEAVPESNKLYVLNWILAIILVKSSLALKRLTINLKN